MAKDCGFVACYVIHLSIKFSIQSSHGDAICSRFSFTFKLFRSFSLPSRIPIVPIENNNDNGGSETVIQINPNANCGLRKFNSI